MIRRRSTTALFLALLPALLLSGGCAQQEPLTIDLMPAPAIYERGDIDPFADNTAIADGELPRILYATDRAPATGEERKKPAYTDARGYALRVGSARIELGLDDSVTWEEARRVSLLKNRSIEYPLRVADIEEFGPLATTLLPLFPDSELPAEPGRRLAEAVNAKLAASRTRDIFIYVHGYKVEFENPLLVASELWHFLGYDGAFIAYSWPSTPKRLAYVSDLEDALLSARNLRKLIAFLAENTEAERIHVLGYSAGTRLVARMLADFGMYTYLIDPAKVRDGLRIGRVILVGSDVDRDIFGGYLLDGALRVPETVIVYQSEGDRALSMSRLVFGRNRVGQFFAADDPTRERFLAANPTLQLINVTEAPGALSGNGHSYFRNSPWVSSDVLMALLYGGEPAERGLVQKEDSRVWLFPDDYVERLRRALAEANPELAGEP